METSVKQRLEQFYQHKGLTQKAFEQAIGVSNGYMDKLRHSPSPDKLDRIYLTYPELNRVWLLTGEGEMLYGNDNSTLQNGEIQWYRDEIQRLRRLLEEKSKVRFTVELTLDAEEFKRLGLKDKAIAALSD